MRMDVRRLLALVVHPERDLVELFDHLSILSL